MPKYSEDNPRVKVSPICPQCGRGAPVLHRQNSQNMRRATRSKGSHYYVDVPMALILCQFCKDLMCGKCWEAHYAANTGLHTSGPEAERQAEIREAREAEAIAKIRATDGKASACLFVGTCLRGDSEARPN